MTATSVPESVAKTTASNWQAKKPYRVALVGAGFIADYHAEVLQEISGVELVGVSDVAQKRAEDFASRWKLPHACCSIEELIERASPDVCHVLAPPALHLPVGQELLEAGVATFLEKPMTTDAEHAIKLADLSATKGVPLGVNHNWRRQPLFVRALNDLSSGKIGPVRHVVSINSLPLFQLAGGMHDHWMFAHPTNVLFEQAPHPLSQIVDLIGNVTAVAPTWSSEKVLRGGKLFYTDWQMQIASESANAQLHLSFGGAFADARLHIIGVDGTIHIDQLNNLYTVDKRTKFIDAPDRFARSSKRAAESLWQAAAGLAGYAGSLMRVVGRKDVYYLGMKASVHDFYEQLGTHGSAKNNLETSLQVMRALDFASKEFNGPSELKQPVATAAPTLNPNAPRTLVIGGTGFIGRKIVEKFASEGGYVRVLGRNPRRIDDLVQQFSIEAVQGDVLNLDDLNRAAEGCDTIVHLVAGAPNDWAGFEELFIQGLENTVKVAAGEEPKRLLFASSIAALYLGNPSETITDETPPDSRPDDRCYYARAKILCELLIEKYRQEHDLQSVVMRPGIVIGPGAPVQHLGLGEWPSEVTCVRWGRNTSRPLPLVLVDDVADAFWRAADAPSDSVCGRAFNLVGDASLSADEYLAHLRKSSGRDFRLIKQSVSFWTGLELFKWTVKAAARKPENVRLTWREVAYRTGAAKFDNRIAKKILGWSPESDKDRLAERGLDNALEAV